MLKRTLTGIAIIAVLAVFFVCGYFISPIFVDILILIFLAGAVVEMYKCLKKAGYDMYFLPPVIMLVCTYPVFYSMQYKLGGSAGVQGILIVLLVSLAVCLTIFTFRPYMDDKDDSEDVEIDMTDEDSFFIDEDGNIKAKKRPEAPEKSAKDRLSDLFANVFLLAYPIVFMTVAWVVSYKYSAIFAIVYVIAVSTLGSDMFAYFIGSTVGGKKLCPAISPKKTVAGAVGGVIGGMVLSIILWVIFEYVGSISVSAFFTNINYVPFVPHSDCGWMWKSALIYLAIGAICGVVSEFGDLAASSIKRAIGIKDYGNIFPGHGGFMDRLDSIMYCLVVLLIAFTCIYGF